MKKLQFGKDSGNSGALIRWGRYLNNGVWYRPIKFRKLWFQYKIRKGLIDLGLICVHYGN